MEELKPCPFCGGEEKHDEFCIIYIIESHTNFEQVYKDFPNFDYRKAGNTRAERTCEMPMVFEDDEGNELESSAAYFRNYRCSSCGEIMEHYKHDYWFFCPNCGARVVR